MSFRPLSDDYVAVATIPADVAPISIPSPAIQRLLAKREQDHNSTLDFVSTTCKRVNIQIDHELEREAEKLQEGLTTIKKKIENGSRVVLKSEDDELGALSVDVFQTVWTTVQNCNNSRLELIDGFYDVVKRLERQRSKSFKVVLNEGYKKMGQISFLLPYDLLDYFEHEITKINEITMNNYYYYSRVHTDLKTQAQDEVRFLALDLMDAKDRYRVAAKKLKVREVMDSQLHKRCDFIGCPKEHLQEVDMGDNSFGSMPIHSADVELWSRQIKVTLDSLDANAKKLLGLYKMAVVHIFNRFFDDLKTITNALTEDEKKSEENSLNMEYFNSEMYQDIVDDIAEQYTCDVADLQKLWNSVTGYMETNIKNTYTFLNGSAHLWDGHFARVNDGKAVILEDLRLLIARNDKAAQEYEKKIYKILDKMREQSTIPKLDKDLDELNKFLDSVGKLYAKHCDAEIKALNKYHKLVDQGIELLISEIDRFLNETSMNDNRHRSWESVPPGAKEPERPVNDDNDDLIPHQMKCCQFQVDAVNNWMFGLWEAIRLYMVTCRKELNDEANRWMGNTIGKLKKRLEVRLATHKPRYPRVKTMIYEVRLKELQDHLNQLDRLEETVNRYAADSHSFNSISKESRAETLDYYKTRLAEIEEKMKKAKKSLQVASLIEQAKTITEETKQTIEQSFAENHEVIDDNFKRINQMICHFSNSIKLFSEEGNYSRDEAKLFKKKIAKIRKTIPKKEKKAVDEYHAGKPIIVQTFVNLREPIFRRLEISKKEFEHNEETCAKVKALQGKIRNFASDTKFKIHRLDACIDYYECMSKVDLWKRKHFDIMKDAVQECLDKLKELVDLLIGGQSRTGESYIFQLNKLIDDSFRQIKAVAQVFYANHGPIINRGKIKESCEEFLQEVRKNYDGFKTQVEIHCLECVEDLASLVLKLMRVNDEVYDGLVAKFPGAAKGDEEGKELSEKLSRESAVLEERKEFLKKTGSEEATGKSDPAVREIVLKNKNRVEILRRTIVKLLDHVRDKVQNMEDLLRAGAKKEHRSEVDLVQDG